MPEDVKHIATERVKWNPKYQQKYGIDSGAARDLADPICDRSSTSANARTVRSN